MISEVMHKIQIIHLKKIPQVLLGGRPIHICQTIRRLVQLNCCRSARRTSSSSAHSGEGSQTPVVCFQRMLSFQRVYGGGSGVASRRVSSVEQCNMGTMATPRTIAPNVGLYTNLSQKKTTYQYLLQNHLKYRNQNKRKKYL